MIVIFSDILKCHVAVGNLVGKKLNSFWSKFNLLRAKYLSLIRSNFRTNTLAVFQFSNGENAMQ